ncbi:MAG TPA: 4-(cytidine 5'-diphospho)-2-C-methyl-D-erythritol kinase [Burkholderiaceae bacterium]|nr:4-(cytidine 5'-diphospho)-2-C-methyl-D-erythritol kinase [Burkholderiaceae bacterium]
MKSLHNVPAPAKLNLFLHITGRQSDGYHLLQSVFMLVDWCDTLHFDVRDDGRITRKDLTNTLPAEDLTVKAARALQAFSGTHLGVDIQISKSIPAEAGMGGGSSDAASCLLALNRLWNLQLSRADLMQIGIKLGADVPFFLSGTNAWVEGIGEQIQAIDIPTAHFLVLKPAAGLSTQAIFSHRELKRDTETAIISGFLAHPFGFGRNDLQAVAQKLCPDVNLALTWLKTKGLQPRMTGSGSAVFAHVGSDKLSQFVDSAKNLTAGLSDAPGNAVIKLCSNLAEHPLKSWAN